MQQELRSTFDGFQSALLRLAMKYRNVVVLHDDSHFSKFARVFAHQFPGRSFSIGSSEQDIISTASGLALKGKMPFVLGHAALLPTRAYEQIRNNVCLPYLNVKIVSVSGGVFDSMLEGPARHGLEDIGLMRLLPSMKIVCPADYTEAMNITAALADDYSPTYLRVSQKVLPPLYDDSHIFTWKADLVKEGRDVALLALGVCVQEALKAALQLELQGISTRVVNMSTVTPLDDGIVLDTLRRFRLIVTVEDHCVRGGLGSGVCELLASHPEASPRHFQGIFCLGIDHFSQSGKSQTLAHNIDAGSIFTRIIEKLPLKKLLN